MFNAYGGFSKTVLWKQNGVCHLIQLKLEPLGLEPFKVSREALGNVVPEIELFDDAELMRENVWVYRMNLLPGKTWITAETSRLNRYSETRLTMLRSLGSLFVKGVVPGHSKTVVETVIMPHLELLRVSQDNRIGNFQEDILRFMLQLDVLWDPPSLRGSLKS
jgi:hypothetical protein